VVSKLTIEKETDTVEKETTNKLITTTAMLLTHIMFIGWMMSRCQ